MLQLELYCVLLTFAAFNSNRVVSEEVAFKNVTVKGSGFFMTEQGAYITSANNLNEVPSCRSLTDISNIEGPLRILRKDSVTDQPHLHKFAISDSNLEHIEPGAFKNLPRLELLKVVKSALQEIEEGVFNDLGVIRVLVLCYNEIRRVAPRAFDNMTNLQLINLSGNKFSQWDSNWFQNTPRLGLLYFQDHQLLELPDNAFYNLRNNRRIDVIDFSNGTLKKVGNNLFGGLKKVDMFRLDRNKIEDFGDGVLNGVETMSHLILVDNEIQCFSGNLSGIFVAKFNNLAGNPVMNNEGCTKRIELWKESLEGQDHSVPISNI